MGESTREPVVRLERGVVVLDVDLDVGVGGNVIGPEVCRVAVSPARALALLDGLRDLAELRELAAEQERAAAAARVEAALGRAVELLKDPLLAGWSNISMEYDGGRFDAAAGEYGPGRGDYVRVLYVPAKAQQLERYAAQAGVEIVRQSIPTADLLDVWVGSAEQGWVNLHSQLGYYPDGRPEAAGPEAAAEPVGDQPAEDESTALADRLAPGGAL